MNSDRRLVLTAAAGSAAAAIAAPFLGAGNAHAQGTQIASSGIRDGVQLITGGGGNVVVVSTADGAVLVDSGAPAAANEVAATVRDGIGASPVNTLFNTHWHLEHTGGNDLFGAAGARIVAHENTRLWMSTEYYVDWQDRTYTPRSPEALPTDTFFSHEPQPIVTEIGGETIEYAHLREAHTDGDIYVFFRDRNVLVSGGVVASGAYPVIDYATGGWIGGLVDATEALIGLADNDTLIVPAAGAPVGRDHLQRQRDMLVTVRDRMEELMRQGKSAAEMVAAGVTDDFDAAWGENRERFVFNIYGGLWWVGRLRNSL